MGYVQALRSIYSNNLHGQGDRREKDIFVGASVLDVKHGWVHFSKGISAPVCFELRCSMATTVCFLYSPFTGEIIKLPDLWMRINPIPEPLSGRIVLKSRSSYCILADFSGQNRKGSVVFRTYHLGDRCWDEFTVSDDSGTLCA